MPSRKARPVLYPWSTESSEGKEMMEGMRMNTIRSAVIGLMVVLVVMLVPSLGESFLDAGTGARTVGMGGGVVAMVRDADAVFVNPSGLAQLGGKEVMYTNCSLLYTGVEGDDLGQHVVSYGMEVGGIGLGVGYQRIGSEVFGENGMTVGVGLGLLEGLQVGVSGTYYFWSAELPAGDPLEGKGSGLGVGVGVLWEGPGGVVVGGYVRDVNRPKISEGEVVGDADAGKLPMGVHVGVSCELSGGVLGAELVMEDVGGEGDVGKRVLFGGEWDVVEGLVLRGGGSKIFEEGMSGGGNVGVGYRLGNGISFDYSYNIPFDMVETQGSHRFSLGYAF